MAATPEWVAATLIVAEALDDLGVRYVIVGGVASIIHGEIRTTLDADLVADLHLEHVAPLTAALEPSFFVDATSIRDAIVERRSCNIIHKNTMFKVDLFIPKTRPFDRAQLEHRVQRMVTRDPDRTAWVASPEDTVLAKLELYQMVNQISERQWRDVLGVLETRLDELDIAYMRSMAPGLGVQELLEQALEAAGE